jgi:succinate dehydrogenase/fumarate reductase flavoprotein subunit
MSTWHEYVKKEGQAPEWPYVIRYEEEQEIETDVLILGGGIAGCWAAISAARNGVKVAMVEKGATIRSGGGGTGCDHWHEPVTSPLSNVDPDERAQELIDEQGGYQPGIANEIQCRESYDTLLELEKMGGKIRDYDDEYKGAPGRDEKTKLMLSPRFQPRNAVLRVWGGGFKSALKKECERLGVKIYDRVMVTGLLNEGGIQGNRIVGAMGINNRTGEFIVFRAKATILCTARNQAIWVFSTETTGIQTFRPRTVSGDGTAMAWRAGASLIMMERSGMGLSVGSRYSYPQLTEAGYASWENVPLVDHNGKKLPIWDQGWIGASEFAYTGVGSVDRWNVLREGVLKGEYSLPFYGDFPGMPEIERRATWNLMLTEEGRCRINNKMFTEAGFDPSKDLPQNHWFIGAGSLPQWRNVDGGPSGGGVDVDWNLKTTLDGLYCAGDQIFGCHYHSGAAATGRYAGRKGADYAKQIEQLAVSREQVAKEKNRVYAPIKRSSGIEWKELHAGIARAMQNYCSEYKTDVLLNMGLDYLNDIEENQVPKLYAHDPHKLMRSLEDLSILTVAQAIIHSSLARKASSKFLNFRRLDYPEVDPPEWNKFVTVRSEGGKVRTGFLPLGYWGNLRENYEAHNKDYTGVYEG